MTLLQTWRDFWNGSPNGAAPRAPAPTGGGFGFPGMQGLQAFGGPQPAASAPPPAPMARTPLTSPWTEFDAGGEAPQIAMLDGPTGPVQPGPAASRPSLDPGYPVPVADAGGGIRASLGAAAPSGSDHYSSAARGAPGASGVDMSNYNRLAEALEREGGAAVAAQQSGVDELLAHAQDLRTREGDIDLSPLLALADSWNPGSKILSGYTRPQSRAEREATLMGTEREIRQARGQVTDDQIGMLQSALGIEQQRLTGQERAIDRQLTREGQQQMAHERAADRAAMREFTNSTKADVKFETDVQKLAKELGDAPANIKVNLRKLDGEIKAIGGGDIPGVGPGAMYTPEFLKSDKGQNISQLAYDLTADLIKLQSGTAASESEVKRKLQTLGLGPTSSDRQFQTGLRNLQDKVQEGLRAKEAGFRPDVVKSYAERGGVTSGSLGSYSFGTAATRAEKEARLKALEGK